MHGRLRGPLWASMGPYEPRQPAPAGSGRLRSSVPPLSLVLVNWGLASCRFKKKDQVPPRDRSATLTQAHRCQFFTVFIFSTTVFHLQYDCAKKEPVNGNHPGICLKKEKFGLGTRLLGSRRGFCRPVSVSYAILTHIQSRPNLELASGNCRASWVDIAT